MDPIAHYQDIMEAKRYSHNTIKSYSMGCKKNDANMITRKIGYFISYMLEIEECY